MTVNRPRLTATAPSAAIDGVLVIDKPPGMTSHDVVVAARRLLAQPRIGHTGTLDPMATGVLPLACGLATRLVSFLTASDKEYIAEIRFGLTTDSYDVTGKATGGTGAFPDRATILDGLQVFSGDYLQAPPPISAKKIGGRRAYELARNGTPVQPAPVPVHVETLDLIASDGAVATVRVRCSAGFYVRALAHALGQRTGTGACLQSLRRVRSGDFTISNALPIEDLHSTPDKVASHTVPLDSLLPHLPTAVLTADGEIHVSHGRDIGPDQVLGAWLGSGLESSGAASWVRLVSTTGCLLAMAQPGATPDVLHPSVVLG